METDKLNIILQKHLQWLKNKEGGERADFTEEDLSNSILPRVNLSRACLRRTNLSGSILSGANLSGADLTEANLTLAGLQLCDLSDCLLYKANLTGAILTGAILHRTNLYEADLSITDLSHSDLYGANLYRANLFHANLSGVKNYDPTKWLPDLYILKSQPPDTRLIAYKFLEQDLTSPFMGFQYKIGETYTFENCNYDESADCGAGGNVATLAWCKRDKFPGRTIVEVSFLAGDIVAVPFNTDGKFRVRKLRIERIYEEIE